MAIEWVRFTKRTDDPKLAWLQQALALRGIESRRNGESWHAPILEVPADKLDAANAFLQSPFDGDKGQTVDDVPDDDPTFENPVGWMEG